MTISASANRTSATGNGVTTSFSFPYTFTADADLVVLSVVTATGVATTQVLNTDYTISGTADAQGRYGSGADVVFGTAPASTVTIVVYSDPMQEQALDLVEGDELPVESLEISLDRLVLMVRRRADIDNRSLRQPDGDSADIDTLPTKVDRASMYLAFDADGNPVATAGTSSDLVATPFIETLLDDADAATARATLDVPSTSEAVLDTIVDAKGDLIVATAADTPTRLAVGANGTVPMARSAATSGLAYVAALNKAIYGLTYANNSGDATNDIDIAVGGAMDTTGAYWMTLVSALTKQSDAAWAVGSAAGGLDTGAVGNSDYYTWLIARSDTGVVDVLFSLSSTAPTMPANYDFKRLIGWFKRVGGTIVAFHTYETEGGGLELSWDAPTIDVSLSNTLTTARRTDAVKVPLNFSTIAIIDAVITDASASAIVWIGCPDQTDAAPGVTGAAAILANIHSTTVKSGVQRRYVRTSAAGLIASRADLATVDEYVVSTAGFRWARRN